MNPTHEIMTTVVAAVVVLLRKFSYDPLVPILLTVSRPVRPLFVSYDVY